MPAVGERKTKGSVTGEWDGTTWRRVDDGAPTRPAVGTRKTKDGITGEWDGTTWRRVEAEAPAEPADDTPTNWIGGVSALAATGAAAVPAIKAGAERFATSPGLAKLAGGIASKVAAPLNVGKQLYDVATGKQGPIEAARDALIGEGARRLFKPERIVRPAIQMAQRAAGPVASALGAEGVAGMAAPVAVPLAGGLAGVAGTAGFLGALQHDANRQVDIDYTKHTPDTDIAKVLTQMMTSEATKGRTRDERMDDPSDVMFRADDAEEVRPNGQPRSSGLLDSILALMR